MQISVATTQEELSTVLGSWLLTSWRSETDYLQH